MEHVHGTVAFFGEAAAPGSRLQSDRIHADETERPA